MLFFTSKLVLCLLLITNLCSFSANAQIWQQVGPRFFSSGTATIENHHFAVDNGTPYVVYSDHADNYLLKVEKFDGINWVTINFTGLPAIRGAYPSIAIDNGLVYVAYQDWTANRRNTVLKYDGTAWSYVGSTGFGTAEGRFQSVAIHNGEPYVAFEDSTHSFEATLMTYDGSNWVYVGTPGFSAGYSLGQAYDTNLIFEGGTPYVSFMSANYSGMLPITEAGVMKFDGTAWVPVGTTTNTGPLINGFEPIAFLNGEPYLVHSDDQFSYKLAVQKFDGTNWVPVGNTGFSPGTASYNQIKFHNQTPYVSFVDLGTASKGSVMLFDGTNWVPLGGALGFTQSSIVSLQLEIDNNTLFVSYIDSNQNINPLSMMSYDIVTSLENIQEVNSSFSIAPNPVTNLLNIFTEEQVKTISVLNLNGQILKRKTTGTSIGVDDLPAGTYLIEIQTEKGFGYQRFVKY